MPGGIRITLDGDEALIKRLIGAGQRARTLAKEALEDSVDHVKNRAVEGIANGPKTGRVYTTYFFTRGTGAERTIHPIGERPPHQASAPHEYPAADTGNLMRSIWAEVEDSMAGLSLDNLATQLSFNFADVANAEEVIKGMVGSDAAYSVHLEYKDRTEGGRPFLRRAAAESESFIRETFLGLRGRIFD